MLPSALKAIAATLVGYLEIWYSLFLCSPSQILTTPSQPMQHKQIILSCLNCNIKSSLLPVQKLWLTLSPCCRCQFAETLPCKAYNFFLWVLYIDWYQGAGKLHFERNRKVQPPVRQGMVISSHTRAQASHCLPVPCTPFCNCHFTLAQDYTHLQLRKCQSQGGMQWH